MAAPSPLLTLANMSLLERLPIDDAYTDGPQLTLRLIETAKRIFLEAAIRSQTSCTVAPTKNYHECLNSHQMGRFASDYRNEDNLD